MARAHTAAVAVVATAGATLSGVAPAAGNAPPGAAVKVSPDDGHRFEHGEPQAFVLSAVDPNGDPYVATVTVRDRATGVPRATLETAPAPSGELARAVATPPLAEGAYTWTARAADVHGATGPESLPSDLDVGRPASAGAGALDGRLTYAPPGTPPGSCVPTTFTLAAESEAAVVGAALVGFVGRLRFEGQASSACEDKLIGQGPLALTVSGTGLTQSAIACSSLTGTFDRVGGLFAAQVAGECEINGFPTGPTSWTLTAGAVPIPAQDAGTGWIRDRRLDGGFTVRSVRQQ